MPTFGPALLVALPSARDKTAGHKEGLPRHSAAIRKWKMQVPPYTFYTVLTLYTSLTQGKGKARQAEMGKGRARQDQDGREKEANCFAIEFH